MNIVRAPRHGRSLTVTLAAVLLVSGILTAVAAQPSYAQILVPVPPGCGSLSGMMVPINQLDDHSGEVGPLGDIQNDLPYFTDLAFGMITLGTNHPAGDYIRGNAVDETICGLNGPDWIRGGSGIDEIFGGRGADSVWGEEGGDILHGGKGRDVVYGDDPTNSHIDLFNEIHGGENDDSLFGGDGGNLMFGGDGVDDFTGGGGNDEVDDFDPATETCDLSTVETGC
jgi:hypothetical protein